MFQPRSRATLLFPSGPANNPRQPHLMVLMTAGCGPADQVLLVPISTVRDTTADLTCIIPAGSHESIQVKSAVMYSKCRIEPAEKLVNGIASAEFTEKEMIDEEIFRHIREGFDQSDFVKPYAVEFLEQYGN